MRHSETLHLDAAQPDIVALYLERRVFGSFALNKLKVQYRVCDLKLEPSWQPMDLVAAVAFNKSHYVCHAVRRVAKGGGGEVRSSHCVVHDSADRKRETTRGEFGPASDQVSLLFYRKHAPPGAAMVPQVQGNLQAKGLTWKDNNCYANALLHALVYCLNPAF